MSRQNAEHVRIKIGQTKSTTNSQVGNVHSLNKKAKQDKLPFCGQFPFTENPADRRWRGFEAISTHHNPGRTSSLINADERLLCAISGYTDKSTRCLLYP